MKHSLLLYKNAVICSCSLTSWKCWASQPFHLPMKQQIQIYCMQF